MNHQRPFSHSLSLVFIAFICVIAVAICQTRVARAAEKTPPTPTPTWMPGPSDPILPGKPGATATPTPHAKLEIVRHYTVPEQVRALEAFELHLELRNVGTLPAEGFFALIEECAGGGDVIGSDEQCIKPIPTIAVGESVTFVIRLRDKGAGSDYPKTKQVKLVFEDDLNTANEPDERRPVAIYILPKRTITDPNVALQRPFPKPNIIVHRTWVAKARATIAELLTPVPLLLNTSSPTIPVGGPEFELVVELQNVGDVEATNILIDFCAANDKFNPVYSGCRKQVPTNLSAGAFAIASQTLAYRNDTTPTAPPPRGDEVKLSVAYQFTYDAQPVSETVTHNVFLYPQVFPAVTPLATSTPSSPYLVVDTPQLNLRAGPGIVYPIIGVVQVGNQFSVIGKDAKSEWWQIEVNGSHAWVHGAYVIARGIENIQTAATIPPPPPPTPAPLHTPTLAPATRTPNPDPVGKSEPQVTALPALLAPAMRDNPALIQVEYLGAQADRLPTGQPIWVSQNANSSLELTEIGARIIVESYQTLPAALGQEQPFQLQLILRNIGETTAHQLMLGWRDQRIVPLGVGTTQWLNDLTPGSRVVITGQFAFAPQMHDVGQMHDVSQIHDNLIQMPVQLLYANTSGQLVEQTEQIALLRQVAGPVATAPQSAEPPLWQRIFVGLIGLGAEP